MQALWAVLGIHACKMQALWEFRRILVEGGKGILVILRACVLSHFEIGDVLKFGYSPCNRVEWRVEWMEAGDGGPTFLPM